MDELQCMEAEFEQDAEDNPTAYWWQQGVEQDASPFLSFSSPF
jgi:hypothetical protein